MVASVPRLVANSKPSSPGLFQTAISPGQGFAATAMSGACAGWSSASCGRSRIATSGVPKTAGRAGVAARGAPGGRSWFARSWRTASIPRLPASAIATSRYSVCRPSWASATTSPGSSASREGGSRKAAVSRPVQASISARRQRRSASSGGTASGKESDATRLAATVMRRASTRAAS
jgi:hypothetical protein